MPVQHSMVYHKIWCIQAIHVSFCLSFYIKFKSTERFKLSNSLKFPITRWSLCFTRNYTLVIEGNCLWFLFLIFVFLRIRELQNIHFRTELFLSILSNFKSFLRIVIRQVSFRVETKVFKFLRNIWPWDLNPKAQIY